MQKLTETWVLRYVIPTKNIVGKELSSKTIDLQSGETKWLLASGDVIKTQPLEGQRLMPLILTEPFFEVKNIDGKDESIGYQQKSFIVPCSWAKKSDFDDEKWKTLQKNLKAVTFLKGHLSVSWKGMDGNQKNKNYPETSKSYFLLINMDEIQSDKFEQSALENKLLGELIEIKANHEDFINVSYGLGFNPIGFDDDALYNILVPIVKKDLAAFDKFLHKDEDRWYKIVLNKALRVVKEGENETYISVDEYKNYTYNGKLIANGYEALVLYFKDNKQMFDGLEDVLNMKKKVLTDGISESQENFQEKKKGGRPKKAEEEQVA